MTNKLLAVENLSISFDQYGKGLERFVSRPIESLSVSVEPGQVMAIVGASGSGKSLLAHAILGILPGNAIQEGMITYKGQILSRQLIRKLRGKKIALIPQSVNYLDPTMKVKRQVQLGLNGNKEDVTSKQEELFERFGLSREDGELYPYQLSGGMLRRVLFATSMGAEVELVIADEPTPGLHQEALDKVLTQLRDFADSGMGVILITHDIISALKISDYVTVFKDGKTLECSPSSAFTGEGETLKKEYTRALWKSLPQNDFFKGVDECHL